jgi:putative endonuclease
MPVSLRTSSGAFGSTRAARSGFTHRYGCKQLVWFELHGTMESAICREKQIKAGSRSKKLALIEASNADWADLFDTMVY